MVALVAGSTLVANDPKRTSIVYQRFVHARELLSFAQQLRQLGGVHRVPLRFIAISMI
jgi:hypothetical protein